MQCLICEGSAQNITPTGGPDYVVVRCPGCGDFEVASSALGRLKELDRESREQSLRKAKRFAATGTRPIITSICF
jgi:hypothetical protein